MKLPSGFNEVFANKMYLPIHLANKICHAYECHDELLEAAKIGLGCLESEEGTDQTTGNIVRSAIAKSEGK